MVLQLILTLVLELILNSQLILGPMDSSAGACLILPLVLNPVPSDHHLRGKEQSKPAPKAGRG